MKLREFSFRQEVLFASIHKLIAICIATIPIFLLIPLLVKNAINMPYLDEWDTPGIALLKFASNTLSFGDLIAQANESRPLFPRLIFLGMAFLTGWDTRYEFLVIFLVACLISYQIYRLSQITIRGSEYQRLFLMLLANLLIFSPVQSDNWLWGIQLITFMPITCITAGLLVSYSNLGTKLKTLILLGLCTISTYSYANGMLAWLLLFPSAIFTSRFFQNRDLKDQRWLMFGGVIGCVSNVVVYFHNYKQPPVASFSESLIHPLEALKFFLIFLGNPLKNGQIEASQQLGTSLTVGLVLFTLFSCVLLYLLSNRKDKALLYYSTPWVVIGGYSCASGLITTVGRLGLGLEAALSSRYPTFSLYLLVSLIYLLAIVAENIIQNYYLHEIKKVRIIRGVLVSLTASLIVLHTSTYLSHAKTMALDHRYRLHAKACLLFINFVDEKPTFEARIYPYYEIGKPKIIQLNQNHFLKPALVESPNLSIIEGKRKQYPSEAYGFLDSITQTSESELLLSGWAVFPDRKKPADAVILAYETPNSAPKAFAIAPVIEKSKDIVRVFKDQAYQNVRWSKSLAVNKLPEGDIKVSAWAFDTEAKQAFRLAGSKSLSKPLK
ncbi:MAG: hypothetical protein ACAF41_10635 [Leptolyngbya sp. BL-A-14]